jgi:NDP-sugar pyrophosphorylase family protein
MTNNDKRGAAAGLSVVVLAGGKGVRLHPFTVSFPKPLVPLGDSPVLDVLIRRLLSFGINDITLSLGHLAELIQAYFQSRQPISKELKLRYIVEEKPTGTAGSVALVPDLSDTFLVMNGDLLTDLDLNALVSFHRDRKALLTIAAHIRTVKIDFGVLEIDREFRIRNYHEKPETIYHVSMGIYVYERKVLHYIEPKKYLDFPDLVLRLIEAGETVCAYSTDCAWLDIGRPDDYAKAQEFYAERKDLFDHF